MKPALYMPTLSIELFRIMAVAPATVPPVSFRNECVIWARSVIACEVWRYVPRSLICMIDVPTSTQLGCSCRYLYCFSSLVGREISSPSIHAMIGAVAKRSPSFLASTTPVFGLLTNLIRSSLAAYFSQINFELSLEPSSMMMYSKSVKV